jgi:Family of unknown function (DUF6544)
LGAAVAVEPSSLPAPVRRYVERVLPNGSPRAAAVGVEQAGEMTLKPGGRPRRFSAIEELAVDRVAFDWRARFPMLGPVSMRVTDSYRAGSGRLEVRVLGLPLQRRGGAELALGEAYRYLAELAWVPHAILANAELEWSEVDERTVEVATRVGDARATVRLVFNHAGEIARTIAHRPRLEAGGAVTPWTGEFRDYRKFGDVIAPARGAVSWQLPDGAFTYWTGTITSLELRG